jgi:hypothetical protein
MNRRAEFEVEKDSNFVLNDIHRHSWGMGRGNAWCGLDVYSTPIFQLKSTGHSDNPWRASVIRMARLRV